MSEDHSRTEQILQKLSTKTHSSECKLVKIRGIPQNPSFVVSRFESIIDNFKTRDGDVFVSTFVKAGDTFIQSFLCTKSKLFLMMICGTMVAAPLFIHVWHL